MKVIQPVPIQSAALTAITVPEDDYPQWAPDTTYAVGDRVIRSDAHRIFESTVAANKAYDPLLENGNRWIDIGPTNRWAMLDQVVGTRTIATQAIYMSIKPGPVRAVAVLDTDAESVRVIVKVDDSTLYDRTMSTNVSGGVIADWYDYFTADLGKLMTLTFFDLPLYANAEITLAIIGADPNGPVSVFSTLCRLL